MRHQSGRCTHPSGRSRGLTAGVAAANHDDVEALSLCSHGGLLTQRRGSRKWKLEGTVVSRETGQGEAQVFSAKTTPCTVEWPLERLRFSVRENGALEG
ncbi:hypothetical protein BF49_0212 [Bradyrhizobium sp.]|nr:hypothetical protein BF49_0212 [Bradyrhizobium sp.]